MMTRRYSARSGTAQAGQLLDGQGVGPVVRHRAEVVEPVGVGHRRRGRSCSRRFSRGCGGGSRRRASASRSRSPSSVTIHAEHAVGRRVLRPHRDLEQVAVEVVVHGADAVGPRWRPDGGEEAHGLSAPAARSAEAGRRVVGLARSRRRIVRLGAARARSPCGVGSYSKSSGAT